jgi:hypothetical protein
VLSVVMQNVVAPRLELKTAQVLSSQLKSVHGGTLQSDLLNDTY